MAGFFDVYEEMNRKPEGNGDEGREGKVRAAPVTVTEFTAQLKAALKGAFPYSVTVKGEISNFRGANHAGHMYFSVKDSGAVLPVVMFAGAARNLKFKLADGMEVIVSGRIDVYEQGGKYNFILSSVTPVGTGALEMAYRQLYAKLEAEGLFAPGRKRAIPAYPRTIALVTSKGAAGLQDQLKVLRRYPFLRVIVVHVPVQGEGAAVRIAAALDGLSKRQAELGGIDLILLGRGGGSFEDLFEFSREEVARAVARSEIPVITGIGHEVDTAIADLVADHHAHTPTEAATYAVRFWKVAAEFVATAGAKLLREVRGTVGEARRRLERAEKAGLFARPEELTERRHQRVDDREQRLLIGHRNLLLLARRKVDLAEQKLARFDPRRVLVARRERLFKLEQRLSVVMGVLFRRIEGRLAAAGNRIERRHPGQRLAVALARVAAWEERLGRGVARDVSRRAEKLAALEAQLRVLGPESVLARGFSITTEKETGRVVRSPEDVGTGTVLVSRLGGGSVESVVK